MTIATSEVDQLLPHCAYRWGWFFDLGWLCNTNPVTEAKPGYFKVGLSMTGATVLGPLTAKSFARIGTFGLAMIALAACQTASTQDTLQSAAEEEKVTEADLRAYCPRVQLNEGTAFFTTYTKGNDDNPDEIIYQASISDVTRTCRYRDGQLFITVAAAGRVVNGPKSTGGNITMPIRVAVKEGEGLPYSRLGQFDVPVTPGAGATQFIYKDDQIVLPEPAIRNIQILIGYDEGPYNTP